jgi:hypothetical protein
VVEAVSAEGVMEAALAEVAMVAAVVRLPSDRNLLGLPPTLAEGILVAVPRLDRVVARSPSVEHVAASLALEVRP